MKSTPALVVLLAAVLAPAVAPAQDASPRPDTELRMETRQRRLIVRPDPPMAAAVRDAEQAAAEAANTERIVRDIVQPPRRAPQLDYGVTSAIQQRSRRR